MTEALKIFIVDDNEDTLLTLRMLLENEGHIVRTWTNGGRAADMANEFQADICLLDLEMPIETGFSVARELKVRHGVARPFMVAISGKRCTGADQAFAVDCGFDHFLEKPANFDDLLLVVNEVADRKDSRSERAATG